MATRDFQILTPLKFILITSSRYNPTIHPKILKNQIRESIRLYQTFTCVWKSKQN